MKCVRFSPDGKWLVSVSTDGTARIWDAATYKPVSVIDRQQPMWCARFSPDGSRMVVSGEDAQAIVYDTATWKPVGVPVLAPGTVFSAVITGDNRFLAITSLLMDAVQFFDIATGRSLGEGVNLHSQATCVDYLVQDKVVVVACDDGTVRAIEAPFVEEDVPPWMQTFTERLVGLRQTGPDAFERVDSHLEQIRGAVPPAARAAKTDFSQLARWELTSGSDRNGMPRFTSTLAANIVHRVNERSLDSLLECFDAVSGDPLVNAALSLYLPNARQGEYLADLVLNMPEADPLARCYAASTLVNAGRSAEALVVINKAIADAPADARVMRRAAKVQARLVNTAESVTLFNKSVDLSPDDFETRRAYGWALYHFSRPAQAAVQFLQAQELAGDMVDDIIAGICLCAAAQKNNSEAITAYGRLVALDPAWKEAKYLADLRGWTQGELDELERVRQAFIKHNGK
jgi:tetratricopeptide (TPR) repeat protein